MLYPVSLLYGLIIWARNRLYDWKVLSSIRFDLPTIAVGNLSVGGAGKSPHVEYLVRLLKDDFAVATLSRGYGRRTRGYQFATEKSTAMEIGDEPAQFHLKFPEAAVGVGENRVLALPQLLMDAPSTQVVILDDAFQHRSICPGLNILITEYHRRFTRDHIVPLGRLRESRAGAGRADLIVVSKCPADLSLDEKQQISREIGPGPGQGLFFTTVQNEEPWSLVTGERIRLSGRQHLLVVTGIAEAGPLLEYLSGVCGKLVHMRFADHHPYKSRDLREIMEQFQELGGEDRIILTTEKDAMRLKLLEGEFPEWFPCYAIGVRPVFLFDGQDNFSRRIFDFIRLERKRIGEENG